MARWADADLELRQAEDRSCPRLLKPGWVKRYMHRGKPLVGYMIACPSCGFVALHFHEHARFVERDGELARAERVLACTLCGRGICIEAGRISARAKSALVAQG